MNRRAKLVTAVALSASLTALDPRPARADEIQSAPARDEGPKTVARHKYAEGVEAYRQQRYVDAVRLFLDADALWPSPALSYDIARAYEKVGDEAATLRWYRNYLRLLPDADNRTDVERSIDALRRTLASKGIQQVTVLSTPGGATVDIDGRAVGVTPLTLELRPGRHDALLTARGYDDVRRSFDLDALVPLDLAVTLKRATVPDAPVAGMAGRDDDVHPAHRRFGIAPMVTIAAGVAALGASLGFELARRSAEDDARRETEQLAFQRDVETMNDRQTAARWLVGAGVVLVVTGSTLLYFNDPVGSGSRAAISALPGGAAFSMSRAF